MALANPGIGNANKIVGLPIESGIPANGDTLVYHAGDKLWRMQPGGSGGGALPETYTVATLPTVGTNVGLLAQVTDALVPIIAEPVVGGGAAFALVVSNGTWMVLMS
jgi:hypothetical protein